MGDTVTEGRKCIFGAVSAKHYMLRVRLRTLPASGREEARFARDCFWRGWKPRPSTAWPLCDLVAAEQSFEGRCKQRPYTEPTQGAARVCGR